MIYVVGRWILGPIDRAARARRAPVRLAIADFLCLFVAVQLPLGLVSRLQGAETEDFFWLCSILAWVVAPVVWISCAVALSRAGITSGWQRFLFLGVVLPVVYYGLVPFVMAAGMAIMAVALGEGQMLRLYWMYFFPWLAMGAALVGCGIFTNRMVARSFREPPVGDDAEVVVEQA